MREQTERGAQLLASRDPARDVGGPDSAVAGRDHELLSADPAQGGKTSKAALRQRVRQHEAAGLLRSLDGDRPVRLKVAGVALKDAFCSVDNHALGGFRLDVDDCVGLIGVVSENGK